MISLTLPFWLQYVLALFWVLSGTLWAPGSANMPSSRFGSSQQLCLVTTLSLFPSGILINLEIVPLAIFKYIKFPLLGHTQWCSRAIPGSRGSRDHMWCWVLKPKSTGYKANVCLSSCTTSPDTSCVAGVDAVYCAGVGWGEPQLVVLRDPGSVLCDQSLWCLEDHGERETWAQQRKHLTPSTVSLALWLVS